MCVFCLFCYLFVMAKGLKTFCWKGFLDWVGVFLLSSVPSTKHCVLLSLSYHVVAMNNHRYAICSMVVSHIRDVQETPTSVGKHCFMALMTVLFLVHCSQVSGSLWCFHGLNCVVFFFCGRHGLFI